MGPTGVQMLLLIGKSVPVPVPSPLLESWETVEITHTDTGRSGFQVTFKAGRNAAMGAFDYELLNLPLLAPFNRVIVTVVMNANPMVLMDGVITHRQMNPTTDLTSSTITITGEDVSMMMDMEEKIVEHPAQPEPIIVAKIVASYAQYGMIPTVIPPIALDPPIPIERTPVQRGTDLAYLRRLAGAHGYVFYVKPGPVPGTNAAYWGPPPRLGAPQRALSYNLGPVTNVDSLSFQHDALAPTEVSGAIQDRQTNQRTPVQSVASTRIPLSASPAMLSQQPNVRKRLLRGGAGANSVQAQGRAQAQADASTDRVVTVSGSLDVVRYGQPLQPQGLVGLRGVGMTNDGFYYVERVTHRLRPGEYKQDFMLTRSGTGTLSPVVVP